MYIEFKAREQTHPQKKFRVEIKVNENLWRHNINAEFNKFSLPLPLPPLSLHVVHDGDVDVQAAVVVQRGKLRRQVEVLAALARRQTQKLGPHKTLVLSVQAWNGTKEHYTNFQSESRLSLSIKSREKTGLKSGDELPRSFFFIQNRRMPSWISTSKPSFSLYIQTDEEKSGWLNKIKHRKKTM